MTKSRSSVRMPAPNPGAPAAAALVLRPAGSEALRPSQRLFNSLVRRIATLERRISKERERLEKLLAHFHREVAPVEQELAPRQLELAQALAAAHRRWRPGVRDTEEIRHLILVLLGNVLNVLGPDKAVLELRDEWSRRPGSERQRAGYAAFKKLLRNDFRSEFGHDADVEDDGDHSAEGFARFQRSMAEAARKAEEAQPASGRGNARDLRKRDRHGKQENVRLKSVRAIYLALAKVLHPDANPACTDPEKRERDMKRAAEAYRREDLATLLELEQRWGTRQHDELCGLGDDVLGVYIATLRLRASALEQEIGRQMFDPRYSRIAPVVELSNARAGAGLRERAEQLRSEGRRIEKLLANVAKCRGKKALARLVTSHLDYDDHVLDRKLAAMFDDED